MFLLGCFSFNTLYGVLLYINEASPFLTPVIPARHKPSITIGTSMSTSDVRVYGIVHTLDTAGVNDCFTGGFPDLHNNDHVWVTYI